MIQSWPKTALNAKCGRGGLVGTLLPGLGNCRVCVGGCGCDSPCRPDPRQSGSL